MAGWIVLSISLDLGQGHLCGFAVDLGLKSPAEQKRCGDIGGQGKNRCGGNGAVTLLHRLLPMAVATRRRLSVLIVACLVAA